jgi:Catalytic LigB subunit of aromatic ring-opening dioxygenase
MAHLVFGAATSHTSMLLVDPADVPNYRDWDPHIPLLDKQGSETTFAREVQRNNSRFDALLTPESLASRQLLAQSYLSHVADAVAAARLDAVVIVGDDQNELFRSDNHPALLVYHGESIRARPYRVVPGRPDWLVKASRRQYSAVERVFPVAAALALRLIETLVDNNFDVATADCLPEGMGESHSISFVHTQLLRNRPIPIVPVFLNAYYPPNQPSPSRCYAVGEMIGAAIAALPGEARIGVVGSGGLSHFLVDEELDREVLRAITQHDEAALQNIPRHRLNSGSSEIRNWICVAGALRALDVAWTGYVPGLRTQAGTGTGLGFALWSQKEGVRPAGHA